jgi:hypothetical protein
MRLRLPLLAALVAVTATCAITAATASAAPATGGITAPITAAQSGGALNGVFTITSFATNAAGQLVANGTFTGTYTDAAGAVQQITTAASSVVTNANTGGGCQVLDLVLGPLHLDLLGLVVDLNQVHLNITAQPGPGNLLGNLLCSVAGLLDGTGLPLAQVNTLLNILNSLLSNPAVLGL